MEHASLGRRRIGVWSLSQRVGLHRNSVDLEAGTLLAGGGRVVSCTGALG
ncbi:hypothetical protein [Streptomyces zaehneri]|nr:hypothetical protein [Streptomyces sp. DSM 40713]